MTIPDMTKTVTYLNSTNPSRSNRYIAPRYTAQSPLIYYIVCQAINSISLRYKFIP